jgi:hypothetical protein
MVSCVLEYSSVHTAVVPSSNNTSFGVLMPRFFKLYAPYQTARANHALQNFQSETSLDTWTGDPHGLGMPGSSEAHDRQEHMRIAGKDTWLLSQLCATGASVVKDSPNSMANPQLSEGVITHTPSRSLDACIYLRNI